VQPHAVMRSLAFTATGAEYWNQLAALCCACGLCTLYACPEELFPKEACDTSKLEMRKANLKWTGKAEVKPHGMREGRRVPIKSLMKKLHIAEYDHPAHLEKLEFQPRKGVLALKQNAGAPNVPTVRAGDRVSAGQQVGRIPENTLGAVIHAPFSGIVEAVTDKHIILNRA
jgi:Na+-translocating ferredoxin:NAD+ oxidoreductase RnfC subunit